MTEFADELQNSEKLQKETKWDSFFPIRSFPRKKNDSFAEFAELVRRKFACSAIEAQTKSM